MPLLSIFTDHDDICFWRMSLEDESLELSEQAHFFFLGDGEPVPATISDWIGTLVAAEDREHVKRHVSGLDTAIRHIPRFTYRIRSPGGQLRWIEQRGAVPEQADFPQVVWLSQDVTERYIAADTQKMAEHTLQEVMEQATAGLVITNADCAIEYCNEMFCKIVEHGPPEAFLGAPLLTFFDAKDRGNIAKSVRELVSGTIESFKIECRLLAKSGERHWIECKAALLSPGRNGEPRIFFILPSIEERRIAAELLGQERDKLQAVFEHTSTGLAFADGEGQVIALNPAALAIFGVTDHDDLMAQVADAETHFELRYPDGRLMPYSEWPAQRAKRGDYVTDYDAIVTLKTTRQTRFVRYNCAPVYGPSGDKILVVYSMNDLTQMRRLHEALAQSQRLETLGRLAGGVAHDFNNVLAVISGNLELIEDAVTDETAQRRLRAVREATQIGASISDRLLTIARKRLPARKTIDIVRRVSSMNELLLRIIGDNIELVFDLPDTPLATETDPGDLDAALLNLVTNARDAMPDGGKLTIAVKRDSEWLNARKHDRNGKSAVVVSVRDTGTGMSPETLRQAPEPFFTTKQAGKGVGLGLTGVYAFADQNGGQVRIDSEPGRGTEVAIYLPEAPETGGQSAEGESTTNLPRGHGELVLVVEDEAAVRRIASEMLTELGYATLEAVSGDEAAALVESGLRPSCILSDIKMPGTLDGIQLAERVRTLLPGTGIVLSSGYHDIKQATRGEPRRNLPPILMKPYSLSEIAEAVDRAIASGASPSGPTSPTKT